MCIRSCVHQNLRSCVIVCLKMGPEYFMKANSQHFRFVSRVVQCSRDFSPLKKRLMPATISTQRELRCDANIIAGARRTCAGLAKLVQVAAVLFFDS